MLMQTPPALIVVLRRCHCPSTWRLMSRRARASGSVPCGRSAGLDRPLELVPARWTALRIPVSRLHHHPLGVTPKTLANHKANLKAALRWFTGETGGPVRGVPLRPDWEALCAQRLAPWGSRPALRVNAVLLGKRDRAHAMSDAVLESYLAYRVATTSLSGGVGAHRLIARTWNKCASALPGWPALRLTEPALQSRDAGPLGKRSRSASAMRLTPISIR